MYVGTQLGGDQYAKVGDRYLKQLVQLGSSMSASIRSAIPGSGTATSSCATPSTSTMPA